jgi:hypothetical protein
MNTHLTDSQAIWKADERPAGLEILLLKRSYVLPWSQFLFAEGSDDEIRVAFTTHDVLMKGSGLSALLADFAAHRIVRLRQPTRGDQFAPAGMCIREVSVVKIESRREDM